MSSPPQIRPIAYLIQSIDPSSGVWIDCGEIETVDGRNPHTVANSVLTAREADQPDRQWRVQAWCTWRVREQTGCDPLVVDGYASTKITWLQGMRQNVPPHADVPINARRSA